MLIIYALKQDFLNYSGVPINQFLKHEVAWVLNNVNTRAHVAPDKCDGQICPYRTHYGFAFESDLMIKSTLPTVSK